MMGLRGGWVLEVDVGKFFDTRSITRGFGRLSPSGLETVSFSG
jgi:hypothetical protein